MKVDHDSTWRWQPLGEVAEIDRNCVSPEDISSGTKFVGLENISSSGRLVDVEEVANGELKSTKFTFTNAHVLYGKLRPYLSKIALPNFGGVCSTDIIPVLPGRHLDRKFLYYFLRQPHMVEFATTRCSGANLPRLSPKELEKFLVPIPQLAEQLRIAAILDKADAIRRKRQKAIELTEDFLRSAFLEMFGDIPNKKSEFKFGAVREFVHASSGKSSKNVICDKSESTFPIYGGNGINGWAREPLYNEPVIVAGRVGQQCGIIHITSGPSWVTDNAIVVQVANHKQIRPEYLATAFHHSPIRDTVTRLDLPFINQSMLLDFPIPLPPIEVQDRFVEIRRKSLAQLARHGKTYSLASDLFDSLVQRAFRGELSAAGVTA